MTVSIIGSLLIISSTTAIIIPRDEFETSRNPRPFVGGELIIIMFGFRYKIVRPARRCSLGPNDTAQYRTRYKIY